MRPGERLRGFSPRKPVRKPNKPAPSRHYKRVLMVTIPKMVGFTWVRIFFDVTNDKAKTKHQWSEQQCLSFPSKVGDLKNYEQVGIDEMFWGQQGNKTSKCGWIYTTCFLINVWMCASSANPPWGIPNSRTNEPPKHWHGQTSPAVLVRFQSRIKL